jgi:hypothetical protein
MKRLVAVSIIAMMLFSSCDKKQSPLLPFVEFNETIVPTSPFADIKAAQTRRINNLFLVYAIILTVVACPNLRI